MLIFFQVFWQRLPNRWYLVYSDVARVISNVLFPYRVPFFYLFVEGFLFFLWLSFYCFILISLNVIINASSFHLVYIQYVHSYTLFFFYCYVFLLGIFYLFSTKTCINIVVLLNFYYYSTEVAFFFLLFPRFFRFAVLYLLE